MTGFYYLHTNGNLIFKVFRPEDDSDFVVRIWPFNSTDRATAWIIILEAMILGCRLDRIKELAGKWQCNAHDLVEFMLRTEPTQARYSGVRLFLEKVHGCDPDKWLDWLAATPKGQEPDLEEMP